MKRYEEIINQLTTARADLAKAETEAIKFSGGLVQALAVTNVMIQKQTVAMLT